MERMEEGEQEICIRNNHIASLDVRPAQWVNQRSVQRLPVESHTCSCSWSHDASYIAWSCEDGRIKAIPWNGDRGCLLSEDDTGLDGRPVEHSRLVRTYEADGPVGCIVFGNRVDKGSTVDASCQTNTRCRYRYRVADDVLLAAGQKGGRIITWNMKTGRRFLVLVDHAGDVNGLAFSPDGSLRLLSASSDGSLKLWHLEDDGNMSHTFRPNTASGKMLDCVWSPDCRIVCGVGDKRGVHLWDICTRKYRKFKGHVNVVSSCVFSPDGAFLATSSYDTTVIVWNVGSGEVMHKLRHVTPPPSELVCGGYNTSYVRQLSIDASGRYILTSCDDCTVRIWDMLKPDSPEVISLDSRPLSCAFSPAGTSLAIGTSSGTLKIHRNPVYSTNLQALCRTAIRRHLDTSINAYQSLPVPLQAFLDYQDLQSA